MERWGKENAHPQVLQLALKRFEPNIPENRIDKRTDVVNFSPELTLAVEGAEGRCAAGQQVCGARLRGLIAPCVSGIQSSAKGRSGPGGRARCACAWLFPCGSGQPGCLRASQAPHALRAFQRRHTQGPAGGQWALRSPRDVRQSSHSGGLESWRECDDSRVRKLPDLPAFVRTNAYLLFYVCAGDA